MTSKNPCDIRTAKKVVVGVDVGGTNTDAVVLLVGETTPRKSVVAKVKTETTSDITSGVKDAILTVLKQAFDKLGLFYVQQVHIGTTHFINALIQKKDLARVSVVRLCGPASTAIPPFEDFPDNIRDVVKGTVHLVNGGYQYDGQIITDLNPDEIRACAQQIISNNIRNIVVSGIFSPVRNDQEQEAYNIIKKVDGSLSVTISSEIGGIGLLERENAAILNECLKPLCVKIIGGFKEAITSIGLSCSFFLTQNDGTLIGEEVALKFPVHTIGSGPTNSMRGAAFLSGNKNCIVVDIGGTTSDIGVLINGFPRESATYVNVGGVRTNFSMPDIFSIGLGGGSYVNGMFSSSGELIDVQVGPLSAGNLIGSEAFVFSPGHIDIDEERVITATDIAVASGLANIGNKKAIEHLSTDLVRRSLINIQEMIEDVIDQVKTLKEDSPLTLVGGGSILIDQKRKLKGVSEVIFPPHLDVANAVGAALSQTSGCVDEVVKISDFMNEEEMKKKTIGKDEETKQVIEKGFLVEARSKARKVKSQKAVERAIKNGAIPDTVEIVECENIDLAYMPGNATRIKIKAVGDLQFSSRNIAIVNIQKITKLLETKNDENVQQKQKRKQTATSAGETLSPPHCDSKPDGYKHQINETTGEWTLQEYDLRCISIGAGILGSGGGGNPHVGYLLSRKQLREGKAIKIISCDHLGTQKQNVIAGVAFMGAPIIENEKLTSNTECLKALASLKALYNQYHYKDGDVKSIPSELIKKDGDVTFIDNLPILGAKDGGESHSLVALMSSEIGGMNSMVPLYVSAEMNLPVADCDGTGRAFPEIQMFVPFIYGHRHVPGCVADEKGNTSIILTADTPKSVENHFRIKCIEMGCSCAVTEVPISCDELSRYTIPHSLSRAWRLGDAVLEARTGKRSLTNAILETETGKVLMVGKVIEVNREISGGFSKGNLLLEGTNEYSGSTLTILFQNEHLVAKTTTTTCGGDERLVACTPDLICVIETNTGNPVPTDEIRYGLRVTVITLACPQLLRTERALEVVGPSAFNYEDIKYTPVAEYGGTDPIPP